MYNSCISCNKRQLCNSTAPYLRLLSLNFWYTPLSVLGYSRIFIVVSVCKYPKLCVLRYKVSFVSVLLLIVFSLWSPCSYCQCVSFSRSVLLLLEFFLSNALLCTSFLLLKFLFFVFLSRLLLLKFLKFLKRSLFLSQKFLSMHLWLLLRQFLFFALLYIFLYPYYIFCGLHIQFFFFAGIFLLSKLKSSLIRLRRKFPKAQSHNGKLYSSNISSKRNPEAQQNDDNPWSDWNRNVRNSIDNC